MKINRQNNPCNQCSLTTSCLPLGFCSKEVDQITSLVQETITLAKGEGLYNQQEKFRGLYTVKSGALKTYLINESGEQTTSSFYLPGEILGFDAIYIERYQENAVALTDTEVCRIPFNALLELASRNPDVQRELFKLFSYRIHQINHHWHFNAEQKLASFLLDYSHRLMRQNLSGSDFQLLPTQQDIASYLDLTPETVSRVFRKFLEIGIYQSSRVKQIQQLDHRQLQQVIDGEL